MNDSRRSLVPGRGPAVAEVAETETETVHIYECEHDCGFSGSFANVAEHESSCACLAARVNIAGGD